MYSMVICPFIGFCSNFFLLSSPLVDIALFSPPVSIQWGLVMETRIPGGFFKLASSLLGFAPQMLCRCSTV